MAFFLIFNLLCFATRVDAQIGRQVPLVVKANVSDCNTAVSRLEIISEPQLTHHECTALVNILGEKTYHHTLPEWFGLSYFAQQQREVIPACVILPSSAEEVSQALGVIKDHQCHFAVKSGGHGMFPGASNAQNGITMDLRNLNELQVSDDRLTTFVGTGTKWGEVYRELEPMNLTVSGGRDTQIGIGGFILGDE
jgi:FAD/FMN-containing dehydrogenase